MNIGKMFHFRFIFRQISSSGRQALIFVLCVALSLLTLVSLGGFSSSVRSSMLKDARQLHAADIIVHSHYPLSPRLEKVIKDHESQGQTAGALVYEFYSMASNPIQEKSLLSHLKVVEEGYPFYGKVGGAGQACFLLLIRATHLYWGSRPGSCRPDQKRQPDSLQLSAQG
jgi:putative ABC transport system permease protein